MMRIRLVLAVLAMLVVMVGSAVPAMAQGRGDDANHSDRGYDNGQVNYYDYDNPGYDQGDYYNYYNPGYDYEQGNYYNDTSCGWYWSPFEGWIDTCY
jgi:hypothetical protein